MTIPEEIEQLKLKLEQTTDEREQAEVLKALLRKYTEIKNTDSQLYCNRLLLLSEKLNEPVYKGWGLFHLAFRAAIIGEIDSAINFSQKALSVFQAINARKGIASVYNGLGNMYSNKGEYKSALKNFLLALKMEEELEDKHGRACVHNNLGLIHTDQGNLPEALKDYFNSLKLFTELGNEHGKSNALTNIGIVYHAQGDYSEAMKYHKLSLKLKEKLGDREGIANAYNNIGANFSANKNYTEALKFYFISLKFREEIGSKLGIAGSHKNIGNVYRHQRKLTQALAFLSTALKLYKQLKSEHNIASVIMDIGNVYYEQRNYKMAIKKLLIGFKKAKNINYKEGVSVAAISLSNTYKLIQDFKSALKYYQKYHAVDKEMLGEESTKQLNNLNFMHNLEQKEKDLEIEQLRNVELKKERDRSEALLLNILPVEVAEELKEKGSANAKLFDDVTVLFTDFKSFTKVSERLTPQQLVDELNVCFSAFDEIMTRYNIEKIKTVGDAYLAVSGLPVATSNHATDVINAAMEIREFIKHRRAEKGDDTFDIRIGVHSGSVVAGIVGVKKFAYDIWGDTVNTAARMEQNSEAGKINISETTYGLVKDKFTCKYRGEIEAKNKGKLKMYFVEQNL